MKRSLWRKQGVAHIPHDSRCCSNDKKKAQWWSGDAVGEWGGLEPPLGSGSAGLGNPPRLDGGVAARTIARGAEIKKELEKKKKRREFRGGSVRKRAEPS